MSFPFYPSHQTGFRKIWNNEERTASMAFLDDIIAFLKDQLGSDIDDAQRWMDTKSGWNRLKIDHQCDHIAEAIESDLMQPALVGEFRQNLDFSVVERTPGQFEPWRKEEALERLIVACNISCVFNQFCVNEGKENVDLVVLPDGVSPKDNPRISEFVELKHDSAGGTPLFAVIEVIKNLCLYNARCRPPQHKPGQLTILAPRRYYQTFSNQGSVDGCFELIRQLNENLHFKIGFKTLKYDFTDVTKACLELAKGIEEKKWQKYRGKSARQPYLRKTTVNADALLKHYSNPDGLRLTDWEDVDRHSWLKKGS